MSRDPRTAAEHTRERARVPAQRPGPDAGTAVGVGEADSAAFSVSERFVQGLLPMAVLSLSGTYLTVNEAFCRLVGVRPEEVRSSWVDTAVAGAVRDVLAGQAAEHAPSGGQVAESLPGPGGPVRVRTTWTLMRDRTDRPWYVTAVYVDQTDRLRAEDALAASEARWRALLAHTADITWTADPDGTITWVAPSLRQLQWQQDDVVGRRAIDFVHPEERAAFRDAWQRVVGGQAAQVTVECRLAQGTGGWTWVRETLSDLRSDPNVAAIVGNVVDVSEQRRQQKARQREAGRFRDRFRNSRIPQSICDAAGRLVEVNPAFARLLEVREEELVGRDVPALNHPDDPGLADPVFREVLAGRQEAAQVERILAAADGAPIPVQVDVSLLRDEHGRPEGLTASLHDLRTLRETERRRAEQEQFFAALSARATDLAMVTCPDGTIVYVSPALTHVLGYDPDAVIGHDGWAYVHPDDVPAARETYDRVVRDGGTVTFVLRVRSADGRWRWVEATATDLVGTTLDGIVCNLRDVTDRVEAEQAMRASEARYRAIVETAQEGIWAATFDGRTLYANARMADMAGLPLAHLYGRPMHEVLPGDVAAQVTHRLVSRESRGHERYELDYRHPDGSFRRFSVSATPLPGPDGSVEGSLAMVSDVTETRRAEQRLLHAAQHDALTGLPNRALLSERLADALLDGPGRTAVLFIDLDDFKEVNDSRGHEAGDRLLLCVADRLTGAARPVDTVGRFGGDEFIVILRDTDDDEARSIAVGYMDALAQPLVLDGTVVHVSASVGVAVSPAHSAGELLRHADMAMYAAKSRGGRVEVFRPALAEDLEHRVALAADLRTALQDGGLTVAYQPIVDLDSGRVVAVEALTRWAHPRQGAVEPDAFVLVAESSGLAPDLDRWVLRQALTDAGALRVQGHDLRVAVNLSARTLSQPGLDETIRQVARDAGLPPACVVLEVTESALMDDRVAAIATLTALRDQGFRIAVDDFGTGYSSLAYLRDLPITELKIDRSFVRELAVQPHAASIVAAILDLAAAVGAGVVAEGVETAEQAELLRMLGCRSAQGWLWSPAVPLDQLPGLMASR